jgi:hypothetical protein
MDGDLDARNLRRDGQASAAFGLTIQRTPFWGSGRNSKRKDNAKQHPGTRRCRQRLGQVAGVSLGLVSRGAKRHCQYCIERRVLAAAIALMLSEATDDRKLERLAGDLVAPAVLRIGCTNSECRLLALFARAGWDWLHLTSPKVFVVRRRLVRPLNWPLPFPPASFACPSCGPRKPTPGHD